jgi:hypothetical protein
MKRFLAVLTVLFLFSGSAFAVGTGFGMRGMAMGGTGIAVAGDVISSAYFNPAGLANGSNIDAQLFAGGNPDLIAAAGNKDFLSDNFDADMNIKNASAMAGLGISLRNIGISVLSNATGSLSHNGGSTLSGGANAQVLAVVPVTLATKISASGSNESSISVGLNIKPVQLYGGGLNILLGGAVQSQLSGSGMGFDLGMQTKLNPNVSFGAVVRNIATSYTFTRRTQLGTIDGAGNFTSVGLESTKKGTDTIAPEVGIGFGIGMPATGTLIALDVENYSYPDQNDLNQSISTNDIHIGLEQGIFNAIVLRGGYFTYGPTSDTFYTYGIAMNIYPFDIGMAAANSSKDKNSSSTLIQVGVAL